MLVSEMHRRSLQDLCDKVITPADVLTDSVRAYWQIELFVLLVCWPINYNRTECLTALFAYSLGNL